jgi:hypothetical protein
MSFNDAYLERLRISKEILAVELTKANKEIAGIENKPILANALTNLPTADPKFSAAINQYEKEFNKAALENNVPVNDLKAIAAQESGGNLSARNVNTNGSVDSGIMQVNSKAHPEFNQRLLVEAVQYSIDAGAKIYSHALKEFQGDRPKALAAYNMGEGAVKAGAQNQYSNQVQARLGIVAPKQVISAIKDTSAIDSQIDSKDRAKEADKQRIIEAEKLHFLNQQEVLNSHNLLDIDYLRLKGKTEEANIAEVNNKYRIQEELLAINGVKLEQKKLDAMSEEHRAIAINIQQQSDGDIAKLAAIKQADVFKLNMATLQQREILAATNLANIEKQVQIERELGIITITEGVGKIITARNAEVSILREQLALEQQKLVGNENNLAQQQKILELQSKIASIRYQGAGANAFNIMPGFAQEKARADQIIPINYEAQKNLALDTLMKSGSGKGPASPEDYSVYSDSIAKADSDRRSATFTASLNFFNGIADMATRSADLQLAASIRLYGAQSKEAKAAFAQHKAFAIGKALINTALGITAAMTIPPPASFIAAALTAAAGIAEVAIIASEPMPQAHAGLTNVPEDNKTYLLKQGERVVAAEQNKDLTKYLQKNAVNSPQYSPNVQQQTKVQPQNIRINNVIDPSLFSDWASSSEGERVITNIVRRNQVSG